MKCFSYSWKLSKEKALGTNKQTNKNIYVRVNLNIANIIYTYLNTKQTIIRKFLRNRAEILKSL